MNRVAGVQAFAAGFGADELAAGGSTTIRPAGPTRADATRTST